MSEALYNTVRPRRFADVIGQDSVTDALTEALSKDELRPTILLAGHYGSGKTTMARLIAASLNCEYREEGSAEPCGGSHPDCWTCEPTLSGRENSGFLFELEAGTSMGVDAVRELLSSLDLAVMAKRKVVILDEAHLLTQQAASALLKPLENPPAGVHFILATNMPERLPSTLLSRAVKYQIQPLSHESLRQIVERAATLRGMSLSADEIDGILARSNNSARQALSILEGADGDTSSLSIDFLTGMTDAVTDGDVGKVLMLVARHLGQGASATSLLSAVTSHVRNCIVYSKDPSLLDDVSPPTREAAKYGASVMDEGTMNAWLSAMFSAHRSSNDDPRLAFEVAMMTVIGRRSASSAVDSAEVAERVVSTLMPRLMDTMRSMVGEVAVGPADTGAAVRTEDAATIEQMESAIHEPLPVPRQEETRFSLEAFLAQVRSGVTEHGRDLLDEASITFDAEMDEVVIKYRTKSTLRDRDWDVLEDVAGQFGVKVAEVLLKASR